MRKARPLTMQRLNAAHDKIIARVYRELAGGTQYGVDFPTLNSLYPARGLALKRIRKLAVALKGSAS